MIHITITDDGKPVAPADVASAEQLQQAVDQARKLIIECERRLRAATQANAPAKRPAPYMT